LHWRAKRREDRILFDYQHTLASDFKFEDSEKGSIRLRASEALMATYYRSARIISQLTPLLLEALKARIFSQVGIEIRPINKFFQLRGSSIEITAPDVFERQPSTILELFWQLERIRDARDISPATLRALWHARSSIDDDFRSNPVNQQCFIDIFREPRGLTRVLRRMNQYGVLGRFIPEFGQIVGRMQHDLFHVYTVDEHTLMVLRNVRRFAVNAFTHEYPMCSRLLAEFDRPEVLYLAALFHDIGKGRGGDHSLLGKEIAAKWCASMPLTTDDAQLITWLVEHHLTMSSVAQKQDVYDPETIQAFATWVGDQRKLTAIYLLTVADIRGTSPKVWNAWKAKLLEDLFKATQHLFSNTSSNRSWLAERQDEALRLIRLHGLRQEAHEDFWKVLDTVYFLRHDAKEIAWHTRMLFSRVNTLKPIVRARLSESGEGLQVMVYSVDKNDLFAQICSFFERAGYTIFDAHIHTTQNGYALDSFYIYIPDNRVDNYRDLIGYIEFELSQQLEKGLPLASVHKTRISRQLKHFPIQPHVMIRADERGKYHVLSIAAGDRTGLLSTIARVLAKNRIEIQSAKIMTLGERAEDNFLISGELLKDQHASRALEAELLQAIHAY
jgi:[protein-PII] uridylyltransferase